MKMLKKSILAVSLCLASFATVADGLRPNKTVLPQGAGERLNVELDLSANVDGDLYMATQIGGAFLFFTQSGLSSTPEPYSTGTHEAGTQQLLDLAIDGVAPGAYPLFQVMVSSGGDPMNVENWVGGFNALHRLHFNIGMPEEIHGDRDGDGFPDDDADKDGFHDDDADKDGFHDDDADKDGFRDDDADKDGFHDDDADKDGFHDNDMNHDGVADGEMGDDSPMPDASTGDTTPTGDTPTGDTPTGDTPTGDAPTGDTPTADAPTGDAPTADAPTADAPTADAPTADAPAADATA